MTNPDRALPVTFADNVWYGWADIATVLMAEQYHERGAPVAMKDLQNPYRRIFYDAQGREMLVWTIGPKGAYLCQKHIT